MENKLAHTHTHKEQAQTQSWVKFVNVSEYFKASLPSQSIFKSQFFFSPPKKIGLKFSSGFYVSHEQWDGYTLSDLRTPQESLV